MADDGRIDGMPPGVFVGVRGPGRSKVSFYRGCFTQQGTRLAAALQKRELLLPKSSRRGYKLECAQMSDKSKQN
jgi:hypothetical protein